MTATLVIHDKDLIDKIELGKVELSNGYFSDYLWESGITPDGQEYDAIQSNIVGNHVAVVALGRCGGECRILDAKPSCQCEEDKPMKLTTLNVGGIDCEMTEPAAQVVRQYMDNQAKALKTATDNAADTKTQLDTLQGEHDQTKQDLTDTKQQLEDAKSSANLDALVTQRTDFLEQVKLVDAEFDATGVAQNDAIRQIITAKYPESNFDGKTDDYFQARFDTLVEAAKNADGEHKQIGKAGVNDDAGGEGKKLTSAEARDARMKRNQDRFKGGN